MGWVGSEGPVRNYLDPAPTEELKKAERETGSSSEVKEAALTRPPRGLENGELSRTLLMALFCSAASGLVVGRTSSALMILSLMKTCSGGGVGMHRMKAPRGMGTKPRASEMPHSRPWMRVTWKAGPPTNMMRA